MFINFEFISQVKKRMSDFLEDRHGFVNVTTPVLGGGTEGVRGEGGEE